MALHFELVTPAKLVRSEDVHMVVVPGTEGDFGVLEGHAPVMSTIRDGAIQVYRTEGAQPENIEVRGGFAEVGENGLTVLAEHVEGLASPTSWNDRGRHFGALFRGLLAVHATECELRRIAAVK